MAFYDLPRPSTTSHDLARPRTTSRVQVWHLLLSERANFDALLNGCEHPPRAAATAAAVAAGAAGAAVAAGAASLATRLHCAVRAVQAVHAELLRTDGAARAPGGSGGGVGGGAGGARRRAAHSAAVHAQALLAARYDGAGWDALWDRHRGRAPAEAARRRVVAACAAAAQLDDADGASGEGGERGERGAGGAARWAVARKYAAALAALDGDAGGGLRTLLLDEFLDEFATHVLRSDGDGGATAAAADGAAGALPGDAATEVFLRHCLASPPSRDDRPIGAEADAELIGERSHP